MALGGLAAAESLKHGMVSLSADFLLLVVFTCIAAPHTLNLGQNARISTLQPFMLAAIALFGVKEAVLLAAVSMTYFWIVGRPRVPAYKALFNLCDFVLSAWIGGQVFFRVGGRLGDVSSPESLLGLLLATLAFFVVHRPGIDRGGAGTEDPSLPRLVRKILLDAQYAARRRLCGHPGRHAPPELRGPDLLPGPAVLHHDLPLLQGVFPARVTEGPPDLTDAVDLAHTTAAPMPPRCGRRVMLILRHLPPSGQDQRVG